MALASIEPGALFSLPVPFALTFFNSTTRCQHAAWAHVCVVNSPTTGVRIIDCAIHPASYYYYPVMGYSSLCTSNQRPLIGGKGLGTQEKQMQGGSKPVTCTTSPVEIVLRNLICMFNLSRLFSIS